MSDHKAVETPLTELLERVPVNLTISFPTQWAEDGTETGHAHVPAGSLMHRSALRIRFLERELSAANAKIAELQKENERLRMDVPQRPRIICLCGSSRFIAEMACIAWALERDEGYIVLGLHLLPQSYPGVAPDHMAEHEGFKDHFDNLHKRKIELAHEILVVNIDGYIGESTRSEIEHATRLRKPVRYIVPIDAARKGEK